MIVESSSRVLVGLSVTGTRLSFKTALCAPRSFLGAPGIYSPGHQSLLALSFAEGIVGGV
jgi:hypothetical protein